MRHRLIPILLLCAAHPAAAQVRLVEAGIVCPRIVTGALIEAPGTEAGMIREIAQGTAFDLDARAVPALDNLGFGVRFALEPGAPAQDVTVVVTHPPMGPRGVTRQEWSDTILPDTGSVHLFTFEEPYEKVLGRWTFGVEVGGVAMVTVPFDVTEDDGRGAVEAACFRFMS